MQKLIKLNYFEHINIFESCKQPGIDNKSSNFIPEMVSCVEIKIQGFFLQKNFWGLMWSVKCPKKMLCEHYVTFWKHVAQKLGS